MKLKIAVLTALCGAVFISNAYAASYMQGSDWAKENLDAANLYGILPADAYAKDYTMPITRKELVSVLLSAYENAAGIEYTAGPSHFVDDTSAEVAAIYELGIMNGTSDYEFSPDLYTTREAMAKIILSFKASVEETALDLPTSYRNTFSDFSEVSEWAKAYVEKANADDILRGYEDGRFRGKKTVSWEEAITLILRAVSMSEREKPIIVSELDNGVIPSGTSFELSFAGSGGYDVYALKLSEDSEPVLIGSGSDYASISGGVLDSNSLYCVYAEKDGVMSDPIRIYTDKYNSFAECDYESDPSKITVKWRRMTGDGVYMLKITEERFSYYDGDISPKVTTYEFDDEESYTFSKNPNRKYTIELSSENVHETFSVYSPKGSNDGANEINAGYPTTKEEADALMVTVTVPVWRLKNGEKISSTADITVHQKIAEKVKLVFEEIYNGPEQFPIKDVGAYAWRGGKTEHNGGTAIDINYNENYCIYNNGTTIGEHWKPYENPYSITPYGDVVNAFEKYGFTWGGDAWRNPKDYMHFSYLGT